MESFFDQLSRKSFARDDLSIVVPRNGEVLKTRDGRGSFAELGWLSLLKRLERSSADTNHFRRVRDRQDAGAVSRCYSSQSRRIRKSLSLQRRLNLLRRPIFQLSNKAYAILVFERLGHADLVLFALRSLGIRGDCRICEPVGYCEALHVARPGIVRDHIQSVVFRLKNPLRHERIVGKRLPKFPSEQRIVGRRNNWVFGREDHEGFIGADPYQ